MFMFPWTETWILTQKYIYNKVYGQLLNSINKHLTHVFLIITAQRFGIIIIVTDDSFVSQGLYMFLQKFVLPQPNNILC